MKLAKDYYLMQVNIKPTEEDMKSLGIYIRTFKSDTKSLIEGIEHIYLKSSLHHRLCLWI